VSKQSRECAKTILERQIKFTIQKPQLQATGMQNCTSFEGNTIYWQIFEVYPVDGRICECLRIIRNIAINRLCHPHWRKNREC